MRMSQLLGRRWRARENQEEVVSHGLLLRAGYIRQHAAGIYSYLNLGLRSLRKIEAVVREEMDRAGAQEILMSVVHSAEVWKRTGRYDQIDETLVRFKDRRGRDMVLAMTHEEIVAELAASDIRSYRDAGLVVYQIQTKFRDELRSRGGLLRTREFIMKDAYSLHLDDDGLAEAYETQAGAYRRIFRRLGLRDVHMIRSDSGVMGGRVAHEFMCLLEVGEDTVAFCESCGCAWNIDMADGERCAACGGAARLERGVEVGNIFQLGTRYTDALGVRVVDAEGCERAVVMGSYGIGVSRLLATLVEQHHDERGIALTAAVASFGGHMVVLGGVGKGGGGWQGDEGGLMSAAADVYRRCADASLDVLWDDRGAQAGEQLADADLIGAAVRITLGRSTLEGDQVELRERRSGRVHRVARADTAGALTALLDDLKRSEEAEATSG